MDRRYPAPGVIALVLLLAACGGPAPSPSPPRPDGGAGPGAGPTAVPEQSSNPTPEPAVVLRAFETQAILPVHRFSWLPPLVVTADGRAYQPAPVPAITPGPLVPPIDVRPVSEAGMARIVADARSAGLLSGQTDFSGGMPMMGGRQARLQLTAEGVSHDLVGDPTRLVRCDPGAPCPDPEPGTPEAFAAFWAQLTDLDGWLGSEVGRATGYAPEAFSILLGPGPAEPIAGLAPMIWPLGARFAFFGDPVLTDTSLRCGTVTGVDAQVVGPSLYQAVANQAWLESPVMSMSYGLTVRPVLPGDGDPCAELTVPAE
jgi:hypothetical protein